MPSYSTNNIESCSWVASSIGHDRISLLAQHPLMAAPILVQHHPRHGAPVLSFALNHALRPQENRSSRLKLVSDPRVASLRPFPVILVIMPNAPTTLTAQLRINPITSSTDASRCDA